MSDAHGRRIEQPQEEGECRRECDAGQQILPEQHGTHLCFFVVVQGCQRVDVQGCGGE